MAKRSSETIPTVPEHVFLQALKHAYETSPRDGMILETLYETGIRNRECRLLTIADVYQAGQIVLTLKVSRENAKGGRQRLIPLSGHYRGRLRSYVLDHCKHFEADLASMPLFPSQQGGKTLTRRGLCRIVKIHMAAAGYFATPHWLRHTAATEMLRTGNIRNVQLMLGHRRLETVQIYTHPTEDDLRANIEARAAAAARRADELHKNESAAARDRESS